jgi:hypothetical protein
VEIINQQASNRNIIKVIIKSYWQPHESMPFFKPLISMKSGKFVYKQNFCKFRAIHDIEYPSTRIFDTPEKYNHGSIKKEVVLCLNQSNLH